MRRCLLTNNVQIISILILSNRSNSNFIHFFPVSQYKYCTYYQASTKNIFTLIYLSSVARLFGYRLSVRNVESPKMKYNFHFETSFKIGPSVQNGYTFRYWVRKLKTHSHSVRKLKTLRPCTYLSIWDRRKSLNV